VIPQKVRKALGLKPGQKVQVIPYKGRIELIPIESVGRSRGFLKGMNTDVERDPDRVWTLSIRPAGWNTSLTLLTQIILRRQFRTQQILSYPPWSLWSLQASITAAQRGRSLQAIAVMHQGRVVDLNMALALKAAHLSLELSLPMADSIMLATARECQVTLWTQDADFKSVEGVKYFSKRTK
jgi:AbrB family looped-hinge helix DNA binding protein